MKTLSPQGAMAISLSSDPRVLSLTVVDSSLKPWRKFDETSGAAAINSSDNGNNGTVIGVGSVTGQIRGAFDFNSVGDNVNAGSATLLDYLGAMTVSVWSRPATLGECGVFGSIAGKAGFRLSVTSNNMINFTVDFTTTGLTRRSSTNSITIGTWQHVVVTWDGSATATKVHICINGTEVGSYSATTNASGTRVSDAANSMVVGNDPTFIRTLTAASTTSTSSIASSPSPRSKSCPDMSQLLRQPPTHPVFRPGNRMTTNI